ncbi:MAG TPA: calcium/proton exchanger [Candidatus Dormibacteraeota bacterium]|jgi:Ca2+:H+ antiporter|nr:calcium/proton exchanger [Candidatus Dormibacteraeota bacterium]
MSKYLRPRVYWLLIFIPLALLADLVWHLPVVVFGTACLSIVPLAALISKSTDELAMRTGPRVGGLLNATFGNIPELIISVLLIAAGEITVVKAALIGSIIGNLILVLGASLLAGGIRFKTQRFSARAAATHAASLLMAVTGLLMPTLFGLTTHDTAFQDTIVSTVVAAVLICLYVGNLVFSHVTHRHLFHSAAPEEAPTWSLPRSVLGLAGSAIVVGFLSELLVGSLEPTVAALGISRIFIGVFVIAIVGNAAEHSAAVLFAIRNKVDVVLEIAFGSSSQVALFVAPLLVFISILLGHPMNFMFSALEVAAVGLATVITAFATMDGRSSWLEGMQLLGAYLIMGISFFFIPGHGG